MSLDIVIPTCKKDLDTLEIVIEHAKKYIQNVGRIFVVSDISYTSNAIHIPESAYPFSKYDVAKFIQHHRCHWYYQQLLKLYVYDVIADLSDNVLILDSETIFYQPVSFIDDTGRGLYCTSDEKSAWYYDHMNRFVPDLSKYTEGIDPSYSGIVHHMVFNKNILKDLFVKVETAHSKPLWVAFLTTVRQDHIIGGASEYEIYFCFAFAVHKELVRLRPLNWGLSDTILESSHKDFLTAHSHLRKR